MAIRILPLAACAALLGSLPALAQDGDIYTAVRAGVNWAPDRTLEGSFDARDDRDTGWALGGAVGYDFKPVRLELESLFRRNDVEGVNVRADGGVGFALGGAPLSGDIPLRTTNLNATTVMVNALYDPPVGEGIRPFIGGGLGIAVVDLDYSLADGRNLLESDEVHFAVQAIAGASYPLTRALSAEISYRFLTTTDNSVRLPGGVSSDVSYKSHSLLFGLRYAFGGAPEPVRAAPEPRPAPAPAPVNRAPIARDDSARVRAGEAVAIDLLANDSDPDGTITGILSLENPAQGSVSRAGGGSVRYQALPRFVGRDRFEYSIQDDAGAVATAIVTVDVTPPEVGPFLVFFDWDKADLRADAEPILDDAAEAYRLYGLVEVQVVGHTDRSGPETYNQRLSQRRADAVRAALVARGIPESRIMSEARGESDPLVPTGDGVREPQNRRVEITFPQAGT